MANLSKDTVLELEARRKIYNTLIESPGLHFREIRRRVGIAYGALQYHLDFLVKHNLIEVEKGSEYSRFFTSEFKSIPEREFMSLLRQESIRRILLYLLENPGARNKEIVAETNLSPSTISWHIRRLMGSGAVIQKKNGGEVVFSVKDAKTVTRLLVTYKSSFLDVLVDRFVDVWEKETPKKTAGE